MKKWMMCLAMIVLSLQLMACGTTKKNQQEKTDTKISEIPENNNVEPSEILDKTTEDITEEPVAKKEDDSEKQDDITPPDEEIKSLIQSLENSNDEDIYSKLYDKRTPCECPFEIEGTWNRTNVHNGFTGEITISELDSNGFQFSAEVYYYSHMGDMVEQAYFVTDSFAIAKYDSEIGSEQFIAFILANNEITVKATGNSADLGFGMNVMIDGDYTNGEPVYTNANILEETFTEDDLAILQSIIPESYYNDCFLFATENGCVNESKDENGLRCIETFVPTMGGYGYTLTISEAGEYEIEFDDGEVFTAE